MNDKETEVTCPKCGEAISKVMYKVTYTEDGNITATDIDIDLVNHTFDAGCPACGAGLPYSDPTEAQDFLNGLKET